ncbi:MAG: hypothetical protein COB04_04995 [Gammaproteobacteria bacterium]|nr:MAG: hypothetical protein COB04_04995 [Gammaproteobacteria bacterium]
MRKILVDLSISQDEFISWYQGHAKSVVATARDGRSVSFPAKILQPFVTREGICGAFEIRFGKDNKFSSIRRLK